MRSVILGVGLGHDASATVLVDGEVRAHVLRERVSGVRHHYGLDGASIRRCFDEAGIAVSDLTQVAVSSTQLMPGLIDDADWFRFVPSEARSVGAHPAPDWRLLTDSARRADEGHAEARAFLKECEEFWSIPPAEHGDWWWFRYRTPSFGPTEWAVETGLRGLGRQLCSAWNAGAARATMHARIEVTIAGRRLPGVFVDHHAAHAASSLYTSPYSSALVVTHDGGVGAESGYVFFAQEGRLFPVAPHYLECGQLYEVVGHRLGFHYLGAAGKLMGLAGYGKGLLRGALPAGNHFDWLRWARNRGFPNAGERWAHDGLYATLFTELVERAAHAGLDTRTLGDPRTLPNEAAAEIALAIQYLTEESMLLLVDEARGAAEECLDQAPDALCLSGGVALNCPANTRIWDLGSFDGIHIEPHCEDGGLSIGAAKYASHQLGGFPYQPRTRQISAVAMLGLRDSARLEPELVEQYGPEIDFEPVADWWRAAAADVAENKVIAICIGASETGPRALGHRSILAHPGHIENWRRVNELKGREEWRPFAPVILKSELRTWFERGPESSPFMLYNYAVRPGMAERIPAVVHRDGTSRVQTVEEADGPLYRLIEEFESITGIPIVLNTSFNGPRRSIVETSRQAIDFLSGSSINALYLDGWRLRRRQSTA